MFQTTNQIFIFNQICASTGNQSNLRCFHVDSSRIPERIVCRRLMVCLHRLHPIKNRNAPGASPFLASHKGAHTAIKWAWLCQMPEIHGAPWQLKGMQQRGYHESLDLALGRKAQLITHMPQSLLQNVMVMNSEDMPTWHGTGNFSVPQQLRLLTIQSDKKWSKVMSQPQPHMSLH